MFWCDLHGILIQDVHFVYFMGRDISMKLAVNNMHFMFFC